MSFAICHLSLDTCNNLLSHRPRANRNRLHTPRAGGHVAHRKILFLAKQKYATMKRRVIGAAFTFLVLIKMFREWLWKRVSKFAR
jgi:hypothetical protein